MTRKSGRLEWAGTHLPVLLYAWFWVGLALSGWLAPDDRIALLESGLVTEGWHLTVLAILLGTPALGLYVLRMSGGRSED